MTFSDPRALEAGRTVLEQSLTDLWVDYVSLGGNLTLDEMSQFMAGERSISGGDYDRLAQSLNDSFVDRGGGHPLAYSDEL